MSNSSPPAPPSSSEQSIPIGTKPTQAQPDISAQDLVAVKQKKTRDLPNLSDCHGCGRRINYSNPRERLQPLDSVWRVVLLCKKCRRQVNSGQLCPYCFKDTLKSVSDCFSCSNCNHRVHKSCIIKYENSAPSGYSNEVGVDVTVCIDCWVPELLRRSIRVRGKKSEMKGLTVKSICNDTHIESLGKSNMAGRSLKDDSNEAGCVLKKKVSNSLAVKARKTALRKTMAAKNVVESANDGLDLILKKNDKDKEKVGLVGESDSTRAVDDAELALQLCHAMNGSARIPKNKKFCSSDHLKTSEPVGVLTKSMDLKHNTKDGEKAGCSNTTENMIHSEKISVDPNGVEANGICTFTGSDGLKPELFTYKRKNRKRVPQSYIETSGNYISSYSFELKPELLTYKRNRRNRDDSQQSNSEAIGIFSCSDSGVLKPELVTYKRNNRKGKDCLQSGIEAYESCSIIKFGELKSELLSCEHHDEKRECRVSGQDANGSCTFAYSSVSTPELVTYKRNSGKMKEWKQCGVKAYESRECNDSVRQISELLTYKRKNKKSNGLIDGSVEMYTHSNVSNLVTESKPSSQDYKKEGFFSNDGRSSSPEGHITDFNAEDRNSNSISDICLSIDNARSSGGDDLTQDRNENSYSGLFAFKYSRRTVASCSTMNDSNGKSNRDCYLLKYSRRSKCCTETLHKELKSAHQETNTGCASFQTESEVSAVGTQTYCSRNHNILSEHSGDVNTKTCSCDIGSSQRDA